MIKEREFSWRKKESMFFPFFHDDYSLSFIMISLSWWKKESFLSSWFSLFFFMITLFLSSWLNRVILMKEIMSNLFLSWWLKRESLSKSNHDEIPHESNHDHENSLKLSSWVLSLSSWKKSWVIPFWIMMNSLSFIMRVLMKLSFFHHDCSLSFIMSNHHEERIRE